MPDKINFKEKGMTLVLALCFGSIFVLILSAFMGYILTQYKYSQKMAAKEQTLHIAESGVEYYKWYLAHSLEGLSELEQAQFWAENQTIGYPDPYIGDFKDQYGTIIGHFQIEITPPLAGGNAVDIKSIGWTNDYPEMKRTIQTRRRKPSWGEYVILINHRAYLPEGMSVKGKAHSNEDLRVDGVIYNLATASDTTHQDPITEQETEPGVWTTKQPADVFLGGIEDGVPIIDFNALIGKMDIMKNLTQGTNYYLPSPEKHCWPFSWFCIIENWNPSGYLIELKDNSSIDIYKTKGLSIFGWFLPIFTGSGFLGNYAWPESRLIFSEATVWVKGAVGPNQITIGAANLSGADLPGVNNLADIIIQDDILYNNNKASVGLIAQDSIMIDKHTGNPDLEINAALIAKEGYVGCEDFGRQLGVLTINGSIAANYLSEFGGEYCLWLWCWAGGFESVELNYDNNLLYNPPPYFPTKEDYQTDMWQEVE
ncbi:MAG: hypothetical protein V1829_01140 [bacterium]